MATMDAYDSMEMLRDLGAIGQRQMRAAEKKAAASAELKVSATVSGPASGPVADNKATAAITTIAGFVEALSADGDAVIDAITATRPNVDTRAEVKMSTSGQFSPTTVVNDGRTNCFPDSDELRARSAANAVAQVAKTPSLAVVKPDQPRSVIVVNNVAANSRLTDTMARQVVSAVSKLLPAVAAAWGLACPEVVFGGDFNEGRRTCSDAPLDRHGVTRYYLTNRVDKYLIDSSGILATEVGHHLKCSELTPSVAMVVFSVIANNLVDPSRNAWWHDTNDVFFRADVCDPVGDEVVVTIDGADGQLLQVSLCDFIYPAWKDPTSARGAVFNHTRTLTGPFELSACGRCMTMDPVLGEKPHWRFGRGVAPQARASHLRA